MDFEDWIPAFAGMTMKDSFFGLAQRGKGRSSSKLAPTTECLRRDSKRTIISGWNRAPIAQLDRALASEAGGGSSSLPRGTITTRLYNNVHNMEIWRVIW